MRRGEIYSLPLRNIDLAARRIYIQPINEDGGTDFNHKPIQVKFRPKAGEGVDYQPIVDYLYPFLEEDLANRKPEEKWFLDKGDGSVWYASPDGMTKGIKRILKEILKRILKAIPKRILEDISPRESSRKSLRESRRKSLRK